MPSLSTGTLTALNHFIEGTINSYLFIYVIVAALAGNTRHDQVDSDNHSFSHEWMAHSGNGNIMGIFQGCSPWRYNKGSMLEVARTPSQPATVPQECSPDWRQNRTDSLERSHDICWQAQPPSSRTTVENGHIGESCHQILITQWDAAATKLL